MPYSEIQAGVDLVISCAPTDTTVARVTNDYVFIHWPWRERDQSSQARWDGLLALPRDESSPEWANTPWRVEPCLAELEVGSSCMVGIPETRVFVREVQEYDPPRSLGWLPKPTAGLSVVENGSRQSDENAGYLIYLNGGEPVVFERV
jgi:hypothetical protein